MDGSAVRDSSLPDDPEQVWVVLGNQTDALVEAWESGSEPDLHQFLPAGNEKLRRLVLVELIKVDLEYRWCQQNRPKKLEAYVSEFPELGSSAKVPSDLIYEEFHVRAQSGDRPDPQEFFARFPDQAPELIRLLGLEAPAITTTRFGREQLEQIEVGQRLEDFDLLTRLGRGAFATVFLARQVSMQRLVALKVSTNRGTEPQTLAQLDHPHVVRVYDQRILPERNLRLLYMQYVSGGTLQGVIDRVRRTPESERNGRILLEAIDRELDQRGESATDSRMRNQLPSARWPQVVCWMGAKLASALDYAHGRGVLHRDVKPANVLLAADGAPKLADFNISFSSKVEGVTPASYFGGSMAYMSPEQLEACNVNHDRRPEELDARSDVYALGVLLWELLTGNRPFDDEMRGDDRSATLNEMTARRRAGIGPAQLATLPPDCPTGLDQVLLKCLAPDTADRFQTAGSVARQLELCLQPQTQRLLRPPRESWRHRVRTVPGALLALALGGIAPHALLSIFNIFYNYTAIFERLSPQVREAFWNSLTKFNGTLYAFGLTLGVILAWPVVAAIGRLQQGRTIDALRLAALRERCINLGFYISLISFAEWILSGLIFPQLMNPYLQPGETIPLVKYVHFMVSQLLCGLLATALGFFLMTVTSVRALYPVLLVLDTTSDEDLIPLEKLLRRAWAVFLLAVSVPILSVVVLSLFQPDDPQTKAVFVTLGSLGFAGTVISYLLLRSILRDTRALAEAVNPASTGTSMESDTLDSFWTRLKR